MHKAFLVVLNIYKDSKGRYKNNYIEYFTVTITQMSVQGVEDR